MDLYLLDWLNLLLRWTHVIAAVAWIGASFYFVGLDSSLTPPEDEKDRAKGVGGEQWAVHGGGVYHHLKYATGPARLVPPDRLHWSMWQAYATWLTGFALFTVLYLFNAGSFLIDKSLFDWSPTAAICTALCFLGIFWLVYDAICRLFGNGKKGDLVVGALIFLVIVFASWLACRLFAGRAAFLLTGAMIATTMSANVFAWIIPGQRAMVAALRAGEPVDPVHGKRGKQRSVHNTYFTLPVLVTMISNHYGFLYTGAHNWLVLVFLMLAGALIRQSFVLRHGALVNGKPVPWVYAMFGVAILLVLVFALAPALPPQGARLGGVAASATPPPAPSFAEVQQLLTTRCVMCHNAALANKGIRLDDAEHVARNAQAAYQQAVLLKTMPLNNATQMTDAERGLLKRWFEAGAKTGP
jgi:uncharacterized membrane protein